MLAGSVRRQPLLRGSTPDRYPRCRSERRPSAREHSRSRAASSVLVTALPARASVDADTCAATELETSSRVARNPAHARSRWAMQQRSPCRPSDPQLVHHGRVAAANERACFWRRARRSAPCLRSPRFPTAGLASLLDFVGAVEPGACDDMSGHGIECIGEGELVGQVELTVQGEELEDVGVWSV